LVIKRSAVIKHSVVTVVGQRSVAGLLDHHQGFDHAVVTVRSESGAGDDRIPA
jgi:hypothetical protein